MKLYEIKGDTEYQDSLIEKVRKDKDGYEVTIEECLILFIPNEQNLDNIEPKVGDILRVYGRGIGSPYRGIAINDDIIFYRTKNEDIDYREKIRFEQIKKEKLIFERNKHLLDYKYNKLPVEFKHRIDTFRKNNPDFRWKYESYELFCSEEAILIAKSLKSPEDIDKFKKLDYKEQKKLVVGLADGHSGNTFGFSCLLARVWLLDPRLVDEQHGALCILVGCKNYGCNYGKLTVGDI